MGIADCAFCGHPQAEHGNFSKLGVVNPNLSYSYYYSSSQCFAEIVTSYKEEKFYGYTSKVPYPVILCPCHEYIDPLEKLARNIVDLLRREEP